MQLFNSATVEGKHRQYLNKWAWLCSNKSSFIKTGGRQILTIALF